MMRCVRQPPYHHPGSRTINIEEPRHLLPPALLRPPKDVESSGAVLRVLSDELDSHFTSGNGRRTDIDAKHVPKPRVLTHALMHHVLMDAASASIILIRTHR